MTLSSKSRIGALLEGSEGLAALFKRLSKTSPQVNKAGSSSSTSASVAGYLAVMLAACGSSESPPQSQAPAPATNESRCLPVVAAQCGCVYACGLGEPQEGGDFLVTQPFWSERLTAEVDRWCVGEECTDAFFAEIVCSGICAPRPADATCALRRGRCVTDREGAMIEGSYQVFLNRDGEQSGTLTFGDDGRYAYAGAAQPGGTGEAFYFVTHPEGAFSVDMQPATRNRWPSEIPDGDTLGVVHFDPAGEGFSAADPRRSLQVRHDANARLFEMHSIVSEVQVWRIAGARPDDP